ncbi:hypothetical protein TeGR_g6729, partial [Tetraparma gracilis]
MEHSMEFSMEDPLITDPSLLSLLASILPLLSGHDTPLLLPSAPALPRAPTAHGYGVPTDPGFQRAERRRR